MSNPTRIDSGLPPNVAQMVRQAKNITDANASTVRIEIVFDLNTGNCKLGAPADPLLFYGIMELAKDVFKAMMEKAKQEAAARRESPPPEEIRQ